MEKLLGLIFTILSYIWKNPKKFFGDNPKDIKLMASRTLLSTILATIVIGTAIYFLEPQKMISYFKDKQTHIPQSIRQNVIETNILGKMFDYSKACGESVYVFYARVEVVNVVRMDFQCKHLVKTIGIETKDLLSENTKYSLKPRIYKREEINTNLKDFLLTNKDGNIYDLSYNVVNDNRNPLEPLKILFHHIKYDYIRYVPIYDEEIDLILLIGFIVENKDLLTCDTYNLDAYLDEMHQEAKN